MVIGLERNQQSEQADANQTRLRVLKNRFSGESGLAGTLYFDQQTGRLNETDSTMFSTPTNNNQAVDSNCPF
jgi:twinkle protein